MFSCERTEKNFSETYELKIAPATKTQKAKVYIDDRDLDRSDELGRQLIKSVLITDAAILISMDAQFGPESFDGVQYGPASVMTVININRSTGQLRKAETVKGGILSATLGDGTRTYQEQCQPLSAAKKQ